MGTTESILAEASIQAQPPGSTPTTAAALRPPRRPRPPPSVATLRGIVVGLPSSGKRTLLRRLEGKDPFRDSDELSSRITVPYHAPGKTWGERIQLVVEIPSNFEQEPDFCVLLLNPRHDPKSLKPYILKLLSMLSERKTRPISVCILINFRDQQERSPPPRLSEEDVKTWIEKAIFQTHAEDSSTRSMIQTGVTSMLNCYGLNGLHHFIYQSYLNRKRIALEEQLQDVLEAKEESVLSNQRMGYDLFLGNVETPRVQKMSPGKKKTDVVSSVASRPSQQVGQPPIPRRTFHSKPPQIELPPKGHDTKKALNDFFGDDDSDDGIIPSVVKSNQSDDDEDDFYYDDDGHRMVAKDVGQLPIRKIQSSSPKPNVAATSQVKVKEQFTAVTDSTRKKSSKGKLRGGIVPDVKKPTNGGDKQLAQGQHRAIATEHPHARNEHLINGCAETDVAKVKASGDGENGWDDDDDLDLEDDHAADGPSAKVSTRNTAQEKPQSGVTDLSIGDDIGWDDDDDLDLDDDDSHGHLPAEASVGGDHDGAELDDGEPDGSNHEVPSVSHVRSSPNREGVAEIATEQSITFVETKTERAGDSHRRQREASSKGIDEGSGGCGGDDSEYSRIGLEALEIPTENGRSVDGGAADDDEYTVGESDHPGLATTKDDDDDEFMIEDDSSHPAAFGGISKVEAVVGEDSLNARGGNSAVTMVDDAEASSAPKSGGLSAAAMAAIQEAAREAQRMLEREASAQNDDRAKRIKKKKKKKEGDEKKRQSRSVVMVCDDAA
ncbi:hypothetical protein MHU86_6982 [Fragilaria crotonensis]|nr:hypothetical protein MHU86_6982 [Fragilaria crotonensis]